MGCIPTAVALTTARGRCHYVVRGGIRRMRALGLGGLLVG